MMFPTPAYLERRAAHTKSLIKRCRERCRVWRPHGRRMLAHHMGVTERVVEGILAYQRKLDRPRDEPRLEGMRSFLALNNSEMSDLQARTAAARRTTE